MCIRDSISHLVTVTLGDTSDQVVDQRLNGSQSSNVLSVTVVNGDLDQLGTDSREGNIDVLQVLEKSTSWTNNLDASGLDVDTDTFWDLNELLGLDELHLSIASDLLASQEHSTKSSKST